MDTGTLIARSKAAHVANLAAREALGQNIAKMAKLTARLQKLVQEVGSHRRTSPELPEDFFRSALREVWEREAVDTGGVIEFAPNLRRTSQVSRECSLADSTHPHAQPSTGRARSS